MLQERGWAVAGGSIALMILWVLFGEIELGVAAVLLLAAVCVAVVFVAMSPPRLGVSRRTDPVTVHEGDHASVTLSLANRGRTLRNLTVRDVVSELGTAEFALAAVPRGRELTASYRIMCRPRGVYAIGPAEFEISDPLGLAARSTVMGPVGTLVVYPSVEQLSGLPSSRGRDLAVNAARPEHNQRGGEDFYTLREYQHGDDLRRVHWPSSAKRDELMIRQLETPWQSRALVILDVRPGSYREDAAFESAVSGAASVIRHLVHNGYGTDLWAGAGLIDATQYDPPMEALAAAKTIDYDIVSLGTRLRSTEAGGVLILVGGRPDRELLALQRLLGAKHPTTVLMSVSDTSSTTGHAFERAGVVSVRIQPGNAWAPAWAQAMRRSWRLASVGS
ncbi:MAG: DUF58 domain-containing protein [Acidimicrobiia bacterium]